MTEVLLVTCSALPDGEVGGGLLLEALAARGVSARWTVWDDPAQRWDEAGVVAVRSTWDYEHRHQEFLGWADSVGPALLNGAAAFAWNTDKSYLVQLAEAGLPVVPTVVVEDRSGLAPAIAAFGRSVVKPRVGAGGRGVLVVDPAPAAGPGVEPASGLAPGPWVVQPLVESVRTEGETSVFVLGGQVVAQVQKRPAGGEIRVHEEYGGASVPVPVSTEAAALAGEAVETAQRLLGVPLAYARADLMRLPGGELVLSELEVTEPGLYLDLVPQLAEAFADLVANALGDTGPHT
ncbi:ATP-grasp domain-containing protein [Nocardioides mesophilus]|uniref:ATP-grasp domain-containing protein n=1 Tax=Nocardioides mesophilus TaxID=433659 RepID=A0A7G9RDZ5_9ACTN|nr:hypothetical protein [Nocardioides mesophilus]QNN53820.1 hypothetical protein H9L09_05285 [Nocardioides mesophilus]